MTPAGGGGHEVLSYDGARALAWRKRFRIMEQAPSRRATAG
jgi:hypothetical protein